MLDLIWSLLLEQNQAEKTLTTVGIALFAGFMLFLAIDATVKQKFVPKKVLTGFLIFLFLLSIIAFVCYTIFLK